LLATLAVPLLAALLGTAAFAQGAGGGNAGPGRPGPAPGPSAPAPEAPAPAHPADERPAGTPPADHILIAPLRFASSGTLVIDGGRLDADSPWADYLAPGMWLELRGSWQGDAFRASALQVTRPATFSYYLGPARAVGMGSGWVEAWFSTEGDAGPATPLWVRRTEPERAPLALARAVDGRWVAVPEGLLLDPAGADGWSLLRGRADGEAVRWTSVQPFP